MHTPCQLFGSLCGRIKDLSDKFLADQISAETGDPAGFTSDLDRLAAFRLLAHAEIEEFLEEKARNGLKSLKDRISAPGLTVRSTSELFMLGSALQKPMTVSWPHESTAFIKDANNLLLSAEKIISENNGIKGPSFFQLSLMAGKMPDEVDESLGASLSSYGKSRGDVAHKSVTRVRTLLAPSAELNAATDITQALGTYFKVSPPATPIEK